MEINGNQWTFMEICGISWKYMEIYRNIWTYMEIYQNLIVDICGNHSGNHGHDDGVGVKTC